MRLILITFLLLLTPATVSAQSIQLGPRPFYLLDQLGQSELKQKLAQCRQGPFHRSDFSIAHRGASLQFPEHTREAYIAAARMGAGVIECDVTFTQDQQLVCRHAQCDLHRTTDILTRPELAKKCSQGFSPADPDNDKAAAARCCTSDITMAEFLTLTGKMDGVNPRATTVEEYVAGTPNWRTDLYAATGTLMSFAQSIDLFKALDVKMTPELKAPRVRMPFAGDYSQEDYVTAAVKLLRDKDVTPDQVYLQSFSWADVEYWLENYPAYGEQAVYLDDRLDNAENPEEIIESLADLKSQGLNIIAPPLWTLLTVDADNNIIPSAYARAAQNAGLDIITWTLERSGRISKNEDDYYYQSFQSAIGNEGDIYRVLEVLDKDIGVIGVFSDWPAAVTYYANCMGIE